MHTIADPWAISEADYPATGTPAEQLEWLLGYAVLAPSSHNTQPWRFHVCGGAVELYADRTRSLRVVDPRDRELLISCGAALQFLRLAMRRFGHAGEVALFPDRQDHDLLAVVSLGGRCEPSVEELRLFDAIPARHTHRGDFAERRVPSEVVDSLFDAAAGEGAWLMAVEDRGHRSAVAYLARQGDQVQFADPEFRGELARWIRPNGTHEHDGMPGYAFGIPDVVSPFAPAVVGALNLGAIWGGRSRQAVENAPLLAVLGTARNGPAAWVAAGQALARVLLRAAAEGIGASFLNQPCEVPLLRLRLRDVLGTAGWPQLVLRLGYPHAEPRATPRRPVHEVLAQ
ncbi:MAG TPA: nitroreductase family protein [Longimicrobium sp.]|nr:nitroreductase family protein [Longimicrobium sp.]